MISAKAGRITSNSFQKLVQAAWVASNDMFAVCFAIHATLYANTFLVIMALCTVPCSVTVSNMSIAHEITVKNKYAKI